MFASYLHFESGRMELKDRLFKPLKVSEKELSVALVDTFVHLILLGCCDASKNLVDAVRKVEIKGERNIDNKKDVSI